MTLPDAFVTTLLAVAGRSVRFLGSVKKRLSGKGPFSPSIKEKLLPGNVRIPLAAFTLSLVLFSTMTTIGGESPVTPGPAPPGAGGPPAVPAPADVGLRAPGAFDVETTPVEKAAPPARPALAGAERQRPAAPDWTPGDITRGPADGMLVSLTFDGGYNGEEAARILDILREKGIKTTVFLTGVFMKRYPDITRRIVADGHEVGNHLMTHPHLTEFARTYRQRTLPGVTREYLVRQLRGAERLYREITGREMAPLWRAPYGEVNATLRKWAFEAGYVHIGWTSDYDTRESLDTLDWVWDRKSRLYLTAEEIRDRVLSFGRGGGGAGGGIILMHLGTMRKTDKAVGALGEMVEGLRAGGYRFVKVSRLVEAGSDGRRALGMAANLKRERLVTGMAEPGEKRSGLN
ncbi:MAG: polysaccharide deacetylase family protein [Thermodesulfobacteriota bacterium]